MTMKQVRICDACGGEIMGQPGMLTVTRNYYGHDTRLELCGRCECDLVLYTDRLRKRREEWSDAVDMESLYEFRKWLEQTLKDDERLATESADPAAVFAGQARAEILKTAMDEATRRLGHLGELLKDAEEEEQEEEEEDEEEDEEEEDSEEDERCTTTRP